MDATSTSITHSTRSAATEDDPNRFIKWWVASPVPRSASIHPSGGTESVEPHDEYSGDIVLGDKVVDLPAFAERSAVRRASIIPLQEWEGYVTQIANDVFTARLTDLTAGDSLPTEETEFLISDVADSELDLLREGAIFRWIIGYRKEPYGSKFRFSEVVFRRLPQWTKEDLLLAEEHAENLLQSISWE